MREYLGSIFSHDGFFGTKFDILKPRWLPTDGDNESESWPPVTDEGISAWTRGDKRRWSRDQGISSALPGA